MIIKIVRVLGVRSRGPVIHANVDGLKVLWQPRTGWSCDCLTEADEYLCHHIDAILNLLDPRVLAEPE